MEIKSPEIALGQDSEINISALSGTGDAGVLTIAGTTITAVNADIKGETFGEGEGCRHCANRRRYFFIWNVNQQLDRRASVPAALLH